MKNFIKKFSTQGGQSLVELLIIMGLMALLLPVLVYALMATREGKAQQGQRMQAIALLKETEEAMRYVRNDGWVNFATRSGTLHPVISGSKWDLASGVATTSGLTQQVVLSDVYRNASGAIVLSGGTLDPSTKKADITITWTQPRTSSLTSTLYFSRINPNYSSTHTTYADFNAGALTQTQVASTSGGEVKLESNKAKWCSPSFSSSTIDLPDGPPVAVAATANASTAIPNDVLAAVSPNTSTSTKLAYVTVTANTDVPATTLKGTFTLDVSKYSSGTYPSSLGGLTNDFKTNDVKYYKSGSGKIYALMATDLADHEVVVAQINDGSGDSFQDSVNKIYKYWTYFNTKIYPNATVTQNDDTGFLSPSANASATDGDGNGFERTTTNAYADGSGSTSYAEDRDSGTGTGTTCGSSGKDRHHYYGYDINLPSGVSIRGVEVKLDAWVNSTSGSPDPAMCVELSWDGGNTWTSAISNTLSTSQTSEIFGGSSNTWGRTWSDTDFTNANFRIRITNVAPDNTRDFFLDWAAVKVYYSTTTATNDEAPHGYGAKSVTILGTKGYIISGGYLYVFDLSNIDSKSPTSELDQIGCRIELDGYDCKPGSPAIDKKYSSGETGATWSTNGSPAHNDCSDGGNIELYADNDLTGVQVGANNYIYVAVGAGTNSEVNIVNATSVPDGSSSPAINNASCGRISGGNASWKMVGSLDFNSRSNTEEAANSIFAKSDGTRAYVSSNGGIDGNGDSIPDSKQFYVINTTNKTAPAFLSGVPGSPSYGPLTGYYYGSGANAQLYPRRSLTVFNGQRAVLVGKDGTSDANDSLEYQVLDMYTNPNSEASPAYCGGLNYDTGFNDLTSVSEADGDNFVYMVANSTSNELKIIQGGPDQDYVSSGIYESPPFTASVSSSFNRFVANIDPLQLASLSAQVAVAPPGSSGCTDATYNYVGPNGDVNAFFTAKGASISATIPFGNYISAAYQNPERCFRYKMWFSASPDFTQTPVLKDMTWSYSQ